jgi:hypothetical protein
MEVDETDEERIQTLFSAHSKNFTTHANCLAFLHIHFNIPYNSILSSGINFCKRNFKRRVKQILRGDGDGTLVIYLFIFFYFKKNFL